AVVVAVSLFSPLLVRPLADLAGWPLGRGRGVARRGARGGPEAHPRRTASAAGLKSSVAQVIDENFAGGLVIENSDGFSPIPAGAALAAARVPGVKSVATIRGAEAKVVGSNQTTKVNGVTPNIEEGVEIEWVKGGPESLRHLADD